jgi:cytochrome P450
MRLRHRDRGTPEEQLEVLLDFFRYFAALTASRRERPTDDLASAIANGRIDGEPLSDVDTASYYVIVASAGHDTTKDAISGGMRALIDNRAELERLRHDQGLMPTAVEEMNSLFTELVPRLDPIELARQSCHDDVRRWTQAPADPVLTAVTGRDPSRSS